MFRGSTGEAAIPHPLPFLSIAQISDLGLPGAACPGFFRLIRRKLSLTWGVQWTSLCYSSMYLIWLGPTTQRICPMRKETGLWLHSAVRKNPVAMGDHCTLQLLIILPLFSYLWVKHNLFFWNCIFATLTSHHYIFQNICFLPYVLRFSLH